MAQAFMEFNDENCVRLIQLYEAHRILWDSSVHNYRNINLREDAWSAISKEMQIPVARLKKKMTLLLATNRKERIKAKKSLITGSGSDDVFKSKWFAYDYFLFLNNKDTSIPTQGTIQDTIANSIDNTVQNIVHNTTENTPSISRNVQTSNDSTPSTQNQAPSNPSSSTQHQMPSNSASSTQQHKNTSYRKKRRFTPNATDDTLAEAIGLLKQSVQLQSQDDSYASFGTYIAHELRKYDSRTLSLVKQAISNVIFEADMGQLPEHSHGNYSSSYSANSTPHQSSHTYTPSSVQTQVLPETLRETSLQEPSEEQLPEALPVKSEEAIIKTEIDIKYEM